jgi:hypothetical protein
MSDLSDLDDAYGTDLRRQTIDVRRGKRGPKLNRVNCEALTIHQGRCSRPVAAERDGRRVCLHHKRVDFILQYIRKDAP